LQVHDGLPSGAHDASGDVQQLVAQRFGFGDGVSAAQ
jgi:hypothetical protein